MALACIEFYFDFTCPYAYMASTAIEEIASGHDAELFYRPMLLGGVFRSIGDGRSPMEQMIPAKARHTGLDMFRYADRLGVPLRMPAGHPMRSVRALRALLSLPEKDWPPVIHEMYRAYWVRGDDIADPEVVARVLERVGVPRARVERALAANDDPAVKDLLRERTDQAVARGVFGAPAIFVHVGDARDPYFFWGQDRLHMVRAVLSGWRPDGTRDHRGGPAIGLESSAPEAASAKSREREGRRARVHFFYDFSSPFAYLGSTRIERIAAAANAELVWRPMLLGAVFRDVGTPNVPIFAMSEAKRRYIRRDLHDWAAYWDVPFMFASHFPQRTVTALRLALLAEDRIAELSHALFRAAWVEDQNLEDLATLTRVLMKHGFPAQEMLERTRDAAVKQILVDNTAEAVARGVFGAPTCIVETPDDQAENEASSQLLFWGQDRLELVRAVLNGWRPPAG